MITGISSKTDLKTSAQPKKVSVNRFIKSAYIIFSIDQAFKDAAEYTDRWPVALSGSGWEEYLLQDLVLIEKREISESQFLFIVEDKHSKYAIYTEEMTLDSFIEVCPHKELLVSSVSETVREYLLYF